MSDSKARPWLKYAVTAGVNLLIAVGYFFSKIPLSAIGTTPMLEIARNLSDAFLIPGMLTLMFGLLFWVASEGALDGVKYVVSFVPKMLIPGKHKRIEKYGDYVERQNTKRKRGFGFLCIVGAAFVALAVLFWGLFYLYY